MTIPFVKAKNYTPARGRQIAVVVIHTMEAPEGKDTAENVAAWFAGPNAPEASAHYCLDANSTIQCVKDKDVAWAAPGCNHNGLQLEHAGYARQGTADWSDAYSTAMLQRSAKLTGELCAKYLIPIQRLTAADLREGKRGICGHADVTAAWHRSSHTDPGKNFPWARYLKLVKESKK